MAWNDMTPADRRKRRKQILERRLSRQREVEARNDALNGHLSYWPQPRFMSQELEEMIGREMSDRPLHGVPSVYRDIIDCIWRIVREKDVNDARAVAVPFRRNQITFLSPEDQLSMVRKLADPETPSHICKALRQRLTSHAKYRPNIWDALLS